MSAHYVNRIDNSDSTEKTKDMWQILADYRAANQAKSSSDGSSHIQCVWTHGASNASFMK